LRLKLETQISLADPNALPQAIKHAVSALRAGGVIAYPTEYCFGLGCDPRNATAIERVLKIKRRRRDQGVILIAANTSQVADYADLHASPLLADINASWPGPNTWLLPALDSASVWVKGQHSCVAMRVTDHPISQQLCLAFGGAIVSTSANRHSQAPLLNANSVDAEMGSELDCIVDAPVGAAQHASVIRDGITGQQLR